MHGKDNAKEAVYRYYAAWSLLGPLIALPVGATSGEWLVRQGRLSVKEDQRFAACCHDPPPPLPNTLTPPHPSSLIWILCQCFCSLQYSPKRENNRIHGPHYRLAYFLGQGKFNYYVLYYLKLHSVCLRATLYNSL